ncbi:MAG: metal-dependent hydrolase [candidate division Zixibacteria bacterium]|nr:metal-dependent hydrolase [candidate division Zixibacteria bacterium]
MVKITYHGHACFEVTDGTHNLIIDPFLEGNPSATKKADDVKVGWIVVTHGHGDHWGDTPTIAKNNNATVITNFELSEFAGKQGLTAHPMHIGGRADFPFGSVKLTIAHHGSTLANSDGYGGSPAGALINIGGKTIYHAGDTGLFLDMQLIGDMNDIDLALLPIGDNFTMGPVDAAKAVEFLKPKKVTPMHYDTFDIIKQDLKEFEKLLADLPAECVIMKYGSSYEL